MEEELQKLFGLSRDAVLGIRGTAIRFANAAALALFGPETAGKDCRSLLPEHLLSCGAEHFVSTAVIGERHMSVSASQLRGLRVLVFTESGGGISSADLVSEGFRGSVNAALANVCAAMDLLSDRTKAAADEKLQEHLSILYHNYYILKRLLGNLDTAVELCSHALPFFPRSTDLVELCSHLASTVDLMVERPVRLSFSTPLERLFARVDPDKVERLLLNLLANSYAATADGGQIQMELRQRGSRALITVADNGRGIPPEVLRNVFTRYESGLGADLTAPAGSGLGLGIARGIAEAHGGALLMESRAGAGTSVYVTLPLDAADTGTVEAPGGDHHAPSMDTILTELSGLISHRRYTEKFMD